MNRLETWLDRLGLGRYAEILAKNDVDLETLAHLTDADLKELGLSLGHRRKLLAALAEETQKPAEVAPDPALETPLRTVETFLDAMSRFTRTNDADALERASSCCDLSKIDVTPAARNEAVAKFYNVLRRIGYDRTATTGGRGCAGQAAARPLACH